MTTPDTRPVSARIATYAEAREAGEALLKLVEVNTPDTKADWLRSEIEKLEGKLTKATIYPIREYSGAENYDYNEGYSNALTTIITRYKEELKAITGE